MNNQRAKEIITSPVMVNVTYNGTKVYMESIDESSHCCTVHFLDQPVTKLNVPVSSLEEHGQQ